MSHAGPAAAATQRSLFPFPSPFVFGLGVSDEEPSVGRRLRGRYVLSVCAGRRLRAVQPPGNGRIRRWLRLRQRLRLRRRAEVRLRQCLLRPVALPSPASPWLRLRQCLRLRQGLRLRRPGADLRRHAELRLRGQVRLRSWLPAPLPPGSLLQGPLPPASPRLRLRQRLRLRAEVRVRLLIARWGSRPAAAHAPAVAADGAKAVYKALG